tara:strand:- start:299 stop:400 length:102 start_codon:yes stop_codon:yes gene_type:complete
MMITRAWAGTITRISDMEKSGSKAKLIIVNQYD